MKVHYQEESVGCHRIQGQKNKQNTNRISTIVIDCVSIDGHSNQYLPFNMFLYISHSIRGVFPFLSPWTWVGPVICLELENVLEMMLYNFLCRVLKGLHSFQLYCLRCLFWRSNHQAVRKHKQTCGEDHLENWGSWLTIHTELPAEGEHQFSAYEWSHLDLRPPKTSCNSHKAELLGNALLKFLIQKTMNRLNA